VKANWWSAAAHFETGTTRGEQGLVQTVRGVGEGQTARDFRGAATTTWISWLGPRWRRRKSCWRQLPL